MGIDISKLTGALKAYAKIADDNDNNVIDDGKENSILKAYSEVGVQQGVVSEEEFKNIFGLETTKTEQKTAASAGVTKPVILTKKDEKRNRNAVKDSVEELVKNGTAPKDLIAQLKKEYQNSEYDKYINEVESVLNMIPAYNSKEDVEKIHDSVKKQLKAADKWDGFHKDILGYLEEQAKTEQIGKEYDELVKRYSDIKKTMAGTELVKQQGDNFKAYVEILKDELQTKGADGKKEWNESYTKEAFEYLEEYAKKDAKDVVESRLEGTKGTTSRKVRKELKLQNKGGDDYQADAIKDIKTERKIFARKNKVEETAIDLENINREDLRKELGKDLFEKLNRKYLGTVMNENGTYDLSKLSDEILTRVGADYKLNQSKDKEMAELTNLERHLEAIMNTDLTEKEVKKLVKLCDYKIEGKNRMPKVLDAIAGGIGGAVSAFSSSPVINIYDRSALNLTLDMGMSGLDEIIEQFEKENVNIDVTTLENNQIKISIEDITQITRDNRLLDTLRGLGIGVLTSAVFDMVFGETRDEKSCISISDYDIHDERYTNADKYKEYIGQVYAHAPEKVEALNMLVDTYHEEYGENWHHEFQQALRDMTGIGSPLNREECLMVKHWKPKVTETPQQQIQQPQPPQEEEQQEEQPVQSCSALMDDNYTDTTFTYTRQGGDSWKEIIRAFYPCLEEDYGMFGSNGAIRRLKKALSYNEDGSFNNATYQALLKGGDLPKTMKLPAQIDGCDRVDTGKVKKVKVRGNGKARIQAVGNNSGYTTYNATDGCDEQISASGRTKQEALTNLKAKTGRTYNNESELLK